MSVSDVSVTGGTLQLTISDGGTISSSADPNYESWQLVAADAGLWVCLPGGQIAAFRFD
jgi:hypothetical protein